MHIALFASAFHPHVGGVEELVRQLAHQYETRGHKVIVVTNRWPRTLPEHEIFEGIPVYRIAMRTPGPGWKARLSHLLTHRTIRARLLTILRRHRIELLHIQCVSSNGPYALHAKRVLGLPLVVTTQGERTMDATGLYQRFDFMNRILREVLAAADFVTACSRDTLDDIQRYFGKPLSPAPEVIYNGIALEDFARETARPHARPYLFAIGRLVPQKGFDVLLEALAQTTLPELDLVIAGEGPERAALVDLANRRRLSARVHFVGRADRPQAVALFQHCAFFVLPSRLEPLGIVNLEAMAAGKAVIAARVGGVPEIVLDEETGLLVPGGDAAALAAAITRLAGDAALQRRLGRAGRARVERFSWPQITAEYERIYQHVLGPVAPSPSRASATSAALEPAS